MAKAKKKWDLLSKDRRRTLVSQIMTYFKTERDEEIGMLAADDMLEFFMKILSEDIYNRAVDDAKNVVKQNFENLEVDLYLLLNK